MSTNQRAGCGEPYLHGVDPHLLCHHAGVELLAVVGGDAGDDGARHVAGGSVEVEADAEVAIEAVGVYAPPARPALGMRNRLL